MPRDALAPSAYTLSLDSKPAGKLTISTGLRTSPLMLSATVGNPKTAGANFLVGNTFVFGLLDAPGSPDHARQPPPGTQEPGPDARPVLRGPGPETDRGHRPGH
jgi:hypothetical protein